MAKQINRLKEFMNDDRSNEEIIDKVKELAYSNEAKDTTILARYTQLKKFLRDNYPEYLSKDFLYTLNPPLEMTYRVNNHNKRVRAERLNFVYDQKMIDKLLSYKNYTQFKYPERALASYLQFISGRRISELISPDIKLSITKKEPEIVKFSYLKKNKTKDKIEIVRLLPNTITGKEFKVLMNVLKKFMGKSNSEEELDNDINIFTNNLNYFLKIEFPKKGVHSHLLRGLYANYYYTLYNPTNININGFISKILNHTGDSSSLNYSKYVFKQD